MPSVAAAEIARMRESVFFEGPELGRRLSRFWILLVLAAIIAAAGVVGRRCCAPASTRMQKALPAKHFRCCAGLWRWSLPVRPPQS